MLCQLDMAGLLDKPSPGISAAAVCARPGHWERQFTFDCPHFAHECRQFRSLCQDADGTMQCFVWHKDQKAVCHCLASSTWLMTPAKTRPHKPMLVEWAKEYLSPPQHAGTSVSCAAFQLRLTQRKREIPEPLFMCLFLSAERNRLFVCSLLAQAA